MFNKKILIGALLFLLLVAGVSFYLVNRSAKQNSSGGDNGSNQMGTGGLGQLPTGTEGGNPRGFLVVQDPSQPYTSITPRSQEPASDLTYSSAPVGGSDKSSSGNQLSYNQAYSQGLVPDQNGDYVQQVDPSGFNQYQSNQRADYALNDTAFLNKYYPDYQNTINGTTPEQIAQNSLDPLAVDNSTGDLVAITDVDPANFKTTNDNSNTAIIAYLQQMSDATKPLDLVYNPNLAPASADLNDAQFRDYEAKTESIINNFKVIPVPTSMLEFSKAYFALYRDYDAVLEDQRQILRNSKNPPYQLLDQFGNDAQAYSDALNNVTQDIQAVKEMLSQSQNQ